MLSFVLALGLNSTIGVECKDGVCQTSAKVASASCSSCGQGGSRLGGLLRRGGKGETVVAPAKAETKVSEKSVEKKETKSTETTVENKPGARLRGVLSSFRR